MKKQILKKAIAALGAAALIAVSARPAVPVIAAEEPETVMELTTVTEEDSASASSSGEPAVVPGTEEPVPAPLPEDPETTEVTTTDAEGKEAAPEGYTGSEFSGEGETNAEIAAEKEPLMASPVDDVIAMLRAIDTLQQMQNKRYSYNNKEDYTAYLADMRQKRAEAKEAYDALTDEEKDQIDPVLAEKLDDTLDTIYHLDGTYPLEPRDDEYNYQVILKSANKWVAYELSNYVVRHKDHDFSVICPMVDVSGSATSWTPDGPYEYGENNYEVTYCCDLRKSAKFMEHYKRINLESSDYYSKNAASHIRAIVMNAYPYVSMEEMKANLKAAGFERADDLNRSDIISAVQFAIWRYSNEWTNPEEIIERTTYGGSFRSESLGYFDQLHIYTNEIWDWWPANYRQTYYDEDTAERVNSLTDYLAGLPGVEPEDDQIIISEVKVSRSDLVPGEDDTYTVGLNIFLNHGSEDGDNVTITVTTTDKDGNVTDTQTTKMGSATEYAMDIKAKDGDTVKVTVEGTQNLAKGVYFYDPEDGIEESQAMVGVAQGTTKVKAEKSFTFEREIDGGIRIFKTEADTDYPMEGIVFDIYRVADQKTAEDIPTDEEIAEYAVEENLAGKITTDATGYGHLKLGKGTYLLIEEPSDKIKAPIRPMYVQLPTPVEKVNDKGEVIVVYEDVASLKLKNIPKDEPGKVSVMLQATKDFNDWGKAQSFTFVLKPVTDGAPMPEKGDRAEATLDNKTASFGLIRFTKPGTYEYTITEIDDGVKNVTYDTEPHAVTVTITKDDKGNLVDEVTYDGNDSLTITNTYKKDEKPTKTSVELGGHKTVEGVRDTDLTFHFVLEETTDGADYRDEASVKGAGSFTFDPITYKEEGVYTYTITEIRGDEKNWKYDSTTYDVTVTVEKDENNKLTASVEGLKDGSAEFVNKYEPPHTPPHSPKVGDDANYVLWGALGAAAAAGIGVIAYRRKKEGEEEEK